MTHISGAGVLAVSVDPRWNTVYIWLAQERFIADWPDGSLTWSDFGGSAENGESAEECAAREFQEETLSCVPITATEDAWSDRYIENHGVRHDTTDMCELLRTGAYALKVTTSRGESDYVTYVKQVPWRPSAMDMFRTVYRRACDGLLGAQHVAAGPNGDVDDAYLEKVQIRLWSVPQLQRMIASTQRMKRAYKGSRKERLRWGFHMRLKKILEHLPRHGSITSCVHGRDSYINLFRYNKGLRTPDEHERSVDTEHPQPDTGTLSAVGRHE